MKMSILRVIKETMLICGIFLLSWLNLRSQERYDVGEQVPILAWIGVPENETNFDRFLELRESGININYSRYTSIQSAERALKVAQEVGGIKILVSCPELLTETEKTVKRFMGYSSLAGYYLKDEPSSSDFLMLGNWAKKIQNIDKKHFVYVNLFPTYASKTQLFGSDSNDPSLNDVKDLYIEHLERYLKEVPVPFISYDHYPVQLFNGRRKIRTDYYKNLEIISSYARKHDKPFWAFSLSVPHWDYPNPTLADIKFQLYCDLAYGAKGLQYFTYWGPWGQPTDGLYSGPITGDGKRTVVYNRIKTINTEIQNRRHIFMNSKVISVWQTGIGRLPEGTKRLEKLPKQVRFFDTYNKNAVVSLLEDEKNQYLMVVNCDLDDKMPLIFIGDDSVSIVEKDGTQVSVNKYANKVEIDPGDAVLYSWPKVGR